jgi:hypothetical protein
MLRYASRMRMIWQEIGFGLAALMLITLPCLNFYNEWDFANRSVEVHATITARDVGVTIRKRSGARYKVQLRFDLGGHHHEV